MTRSSYDDDRPRKPIAGHAPGRWTGETYYGRPQLKPAPFEPNVVGAYIFLAGLSGASALLGAIANTKGGTVAGRVARAGISRRRGSGNTELVRRSRYFSLLAPSLGSVLLIYDLHTPKRFYNMFRVAKATSPMSIGTWILVSFSAFAGIAGGAQVVGDLKPRWRWPERVASIAQVPAALAGAGLSTYTAALLSATSTPLWAAAPRQHAMRFGSSSVATAAAALAATEPSPRKRRTLDGILMASLAIETVASILTEERYHRAGIADARSGSWSKVEKIGATGLGVYLPLGLLVASRLRGWRPGKLARAADLFAVAGSAVMRVSILGEGMASARRPDISMRFAQPDNLPSKR